MTATKFPSLYSKRAVEQFLDVDNAQATITSLLKGWSSGDAAALDELLPFVYADLRAMARRRLSHERDHDTIQPTALVHDVFLRLVGAEDLHVESRAHFFHMAGRMMRRILIDRSRAWNAAKRGGDWRRVDLVEALDLPIPESTSLDLLCSAVDALEQIDPRLAKVVELRYFVGLTVTAVANVLGVDERTVYRDWTLAKVWLKREMAP